MRINRLPYFFPTGRKREAERRRARRLQCPQGHGLMLLREPGTPEQAWCGTWYSCPHCLSSLVIPSKALVDSHQAAGRQS